MGKKNKKGSGSSGSKGRKAASIGQELRDAAEPVMRLAGSPIVSELIASALIAGAGALVKSKPGEAAAHEARDKAGDLVVEAQEAGRKSVDLASLVAYSVAIAAGEIAARLAATYERQVGASEAAEQVAKAARQAADAAWRAFGKDDG